MSIVEDNYFVDVSLLSETAKTTVVPNGETWEIHRFVGSAAYNQDTKACLVWDYDGTPELIFATHGDGVFQGAYEVVGDGVKKLAICLVNDTLSTKSLGGQYVARKV